MYGIEGVRVQVVTTLTLAYNRYYFIKLSYGGADLPQTPSTELSSYSQQLRLLLSISLLEGEFVECNVD